MMFAIKLFVNLLICKTTCVLNISSVVVLSIHIHVVHSSAFNHPKFILFRYKMFVKGYARARTELEKTRERSKPK